VEKTQGNGVETDTLDIHYYVHGKKRYYEQLSGGMKLAVAFSLKLGLSFLLQKMAGISVKFLLLDEIDQSLDNASVDTFAEIIRFFQKDFTIMVITHNARLKEKFAHSILVQQDINSVSTAALTTTQS
jgi:DNA repair exonuclease SbcCD ATPase subunit